MLSQHLPAVKVGGRRLSLSSKAKPAVGIEPQAMLSEPQPGEPEPVTDYPRPLPASLLTDEEKEKKKQGYMDMQDKEKKKPSTDSHHKKAVDATKATNATGNKRDPSARISQPPNRGLEF